MMNSEQHIVKCQRFRFKLITRYSLLVTVFALFTFYFLLPTDVYAINANKTVLPNGLVVLHSEKHSLPIVMVTLLIKASPLNEPKDKAGLAFIRSVTITMGR